MLRRLIRSLPTRTGVIGVATCDKGLPAMMMALAGMHDLPCVLVPGGVTLPPSDGEDAGKIQTIGARFAHGQITPARGGRPGLPGLRVAGRRLPVPRHRGHVAGGRPRRSACRCRTPPWRRPASRSGSTWPAARPGPSPHWQTRKIHTRHILTDAAVRNAMAVHAAFGGSTNLLLHIPAIAYHAGLRRPTVEDWIAVNRRVPRLVDALPNGPVGHPTVRVFLAGGVPEVMLHLRRLGLLDATCLTVTGEPLGRVLDWWETVRAAPAAARGAAAARTASIPTTSS